MPMTAMTTLAAATTQPMWVAVRDRVEWMDWAALIAGIFAGVLVGKLASSITLTAGRRVGRRGWATHAETLEDAAGPISLALVTFGLNMGMVALWNDLLRDPADPAILGVHLFYTKVIRLLYICSIAWFLFNLVDVVDAALRKLTERTESKLDDQIVPLIRKTLRIFVVVVFALFTAQNVFEQDITAWLAGLGIAGLAVSLAAQDSIKNLFGSVTIFMDHPFGVGDYIKVAGYEGSVEEIGFRSTKLRGPAGNVVSIPNSKIVDGPAENVSARPNLQRVVDFRLALDTPAGKVREAVDAVRGILADPEFAAAYLNPEKFAPRAYFDEVAHEGFRVRVTYWYYPASDGWGFQDHGQRLNLRVLGALDGIGVRLAVPVREVVERRDGGGGGGQAA